MLDEANSRDSEGPSSLAYHRMVPTENLDTYSLLYAIEVGLREFIIEALQDKFGPTWWKHRLPEEVLKKYREGRRYEKNIRWCRPVPHHPLYYTDFPHLRQIIERSDNWRDAFGSLISRQDLLLSTISELEPIRNKIAHNRKVSRADVKIVEAAYEKVSSEVGKTHFSELVKRCTAATDLPDNLRLLRQEAEHSFQCCKECKPLQELTNWKKIQSKWWFDADYLGHEIGAIQDFFTIMSDYVKLPRFRGVGHEIESWVGNKNIEERYNRAAQQIVAILQGEEGE